MDISLIEIILVCSMAINFWLLTKCALKSSTDFAVNSLANSTESLQLQISELNNFVKNKDIHHTELTNSLIYHLHASGTSNIDKIWETYSLNIKEIWDEEQEWPNYMPFCGDPDQIESEIDEDRYNWWLNVTKSNEYLNDSELQINYDYVYELDLGNPQR